MTASTTTQPPVIPHGYMADAQGRLVPETMVKPIDKLRDQTVNNIARQALNLVEILRKFKAMAFDDIATFIATSAEQYEVDIGGEKGNVTLMSYDGRFKVVRSVAELIQFDEQLLAAKALVDECLQEWAEESGAELRTLVNQAFRVNASGSVRTSEVLRLLRYDIKDERWQRAMAAIRNAISVVGTKSYIRIYQRVGTTDQYEAISLDIAKL